MLANKPVNRVSVDLVACHDTMGSRSREAIATPRPCGGIRLLNSGYESQPTPPQPYWYVVFPFALKGHRKRALLQGVVNSEVFFAIPSNAILNFISKVRM